MKSALIYQNRNSKKLLLYEVFNFFLTDLLLSLYIKDINLIKAIQILYN